MNRPRFFRWYRVIPLIAMFVLSVSTLVLYALRDSNTWKYFYPVKHEEIIVSACKRYDVDPYLVASVIKCESNWDEKAVSHAGAQGLMQMMSATAEHLAKTGAVSAKRFDPRRLSEPEVNIEYGVCYLSMLAKQFSSRDEVIAAYNAGPTQVSAWKKDNETPIQKSITFAETGAYVTSVNQTYECYKRLYPQGIGHHD